MCCRNRRRNNRACSSQPPIEDNNNNHRRQPPSKADSSLASAAIDTAVRFPSPLAQERRNQNEINEEVLHNAGINPPSYEETIKQTMTTEKLNKARPSSASVASSAGPPAFTPPPTVASSVAGDDNSRALQSLINDKPLWESRREGANTRNFIAPRVPSPHSAPRVPSPLDDGDRRSRTSSFRERRDERWAEHAARKESRRAEHAQRREDGSRSRELKKAEKVARKAEKWTERARELGYAY